MNQSNKKMPKIELYNLFSLKYEGLKPFTSWEDVSLRTRFKTYYRHRSYYKQTTCLERNGTNIFDVICVNALLSNALETANKCLKSKCV